jgi:hypothetical protein
MMLIERIKLNKFVAAFGYATVADGTHVFYKRYEYRSKFAYSVQRKFVQGPMSQVCAINIGGGNTLYCSPFRDYTPIRMEKLDHVINAKPYANIYGLPSAIHNYGNYLNTNTRTAHRYLQTVFRKHMRAELPDNISMFKPDYPHFPDDCQDIYYSKQTNIIGTASVTKIRLI